MKSDLIRPDVLLPELLSAHPELRAVFDRWGLAGCGGPLGPPETVEFFARAHGVELAGLLDELRAARRAPQGAPAPLELPVATRPQLRDRIYRRFFLGGIAVLLTAGGGWGVWLLLSIAAHESLTAPSIFAINAHGQAQIYGWVGLFILGFAYQAFPRFKHTELPLVPLANLSFFVMAAGILVRSAFEPQAPSPWAWLALVGVGLQLVAVAMFAVVVATLYRRAEGPLEVNDRYVLAAVFWFAAATAFDVFHVHGMLAASGREALLTQVATYQFALRDMQIQGVAMMMIFGVSLRYFPAILGTARPSLALARRLWLPLNLAILGEVVGFVGFMRTRSASLAVLMGVAMTAAATLAIAYAANLRLFRRATEPERSLKFLRASHVWLALSMVMLVAAPLYFRLSGQSFSHAWYGAMRHAITVGFISLTIMGVAAKVVPTLAGIHTRQLGDLTVPFLLVNAGCALRVGGQVATDFTAAAYPVAGISGLLELTGLAIWAGGLVRVLLGKVKPLSVAALKPGAIGADAIVAHVVEAHPELVPALRELGFELIDNPLLLRTLARGVTLRQACGLKGKDLGAVLERLNAAVAAPKRAAAELDFSATVSEWVTRYPGTLPVFARLGMDSCCGGAETVVNAARHNGVELSSLEKELVDHVG
jgi:NnrS protein/Domain of unknown function (DUF1858)/Domain of Unknown function (DUF542)